MVKKKQEIKNERIDAKQLKSYLDRIEKLEEDATNIRSDINAIYSEAKEYGYDPKIMKVVLKLRKMDDAEKCELDELTEVYRQALNI